MTTFTNLQKIKTQVKHPLLEDNDYISALNTRKLVETEIYSDANLQAIELTRADLLVIMAGFCDEKEGGYDVKKSAHLLELASGIYDRHGVYNPLKKRATAEFKSIW